MSDLTAIQNEPAQSDIPAPALDPNPVKPVFGETATASTEAAAPVWPEWAPPMPDLPVTEQAQPGRPPTFEELTAAIDTPAVHPNDYRLPNLTGGEEITPEGMLELQGIRSALWHAGMPVAEGNTLLAIMAEEGAHVDHDMSDEAFDLQVKQTERTLKEMLGEQEYTRCHSALSTLLNDINGKTGGKLGDYLGDQAHVILQPRVYARLLQHAGRLELRKRSGP